MKQYNKLLTDEFIQLDINNPLNEHPFPQFKRESYFSLNGKWSYKISKNKNDFSDINEEIIVPYVVESFASSVNKRINKGDYIIYKKHFSLPINFIKENTFINLLGVDQKFTLIINDIVFNEITPLALPTKIDISKAIKQDNEIIIVVQDDLDYKLPKGKQSKKPNGIFYTPFSGIYYPIYLESVDNNYIDSINIKTTVNTLYLDINSTASHFNVIIKENNTTIYNKKEDSNNIIIEFDNPIYWDIDNPFLYDLEISTESDKIKSYFGLREFKLTNDTFYLNNKPIFLNGLLSQGYYPEGIVTPSSYSTIKKDVLLMKELGFNTLREHIKIEIPYFYYLCDKYGMIVLQDFINFGKYNFIKDTALPTIGFQKISDKKMNNDKILRSNFYECGERLINYLYNHPCIIGYTIFNEGWGQFDSDNVYNYFKSKYPDLVFDSTSGWYHQKNSDLKSYHWYFNNLKKLKKQKSKIFLSEFGALCFKVKKHCYGNDKVFGYTYFDSKEALEKEYIKLFEEKIIPYKDKLNGIIYTQLSDIEEEDNGIITYDRKIIKISPEIIKNINNKLNN